MWILCRNLFCCQWGHTERNWQGKRVHSKTPGARAGSICGNGNYTCCGLYGQLLLSLSLSLPPGSPSSELVAYYQLHVLCPQRFLFVKDVPMHYLVFMQLPCSICSDVFVPILEWPIKKSRLPKKLSRNLKSLT